MEKFDIVRPQLEKQYENVVYDYNNGWSREALEQDYTRHCANNPDEPRILQRSYLLSLIFTHAPLAIEPDNPFPGKLETYNLLSQDRNDHWRKMMDEEFGAERENAYELGIGYMVDFSHKAPDWNRLLELGLTGLRDRASAAGDAPFHRACVMVYEAAITLCRRLGLDSLAERPPQNLLEAFQLSYLLHELIEYSGEEVRTMGHFDRQYLKFYRQDLASGRLTRDSAKELIKYFWIAFYAKYQGKRFGKNFCFGPDFNELSYLGMEVYYEMNIVDPKLSVLVRDDIPQDFLELYVRCIRDGRNGIVSLNDRVIIEGLIKHGREPEDAENYIPIGCYEPSVLGKEISISGATHLYLPVFLQRVLAGNQEYPTFARLKEAFFSELKKQAIHLARQQSRCEKIWPYINPVPLLSATYDDCIAKGKDITEGGAKYNTTGCVVSYFADAVDSLAAIEYLVYQEKICTLAELRRALAADWQGYEHLRLIAQSRAPKWGNNDDRADSMGVEIANIIAPFLSGLDNGRGGKIFPSLYGQLVVERGEKTAALPSGRPAGEPMSKNMCACVSMDRNGVTALMNSVLKIDMSQYPCGTCLDLMLHPSAVAGAEGIANIAAVIRTFIAKGGSGLQFNIFDASTLRDAQKHPEKYHNLQVRVCGWNVRFTDLTPQAQETFIAQAEALAC